MAILIISSQAGTLVVFRMASAAGGTGYSRGVHDVFHSRQYWYLQLSLLSTYDQSEFKLNRLLFISLIA
jgi:hypothetical protein